MQSCSAESKNKTNELEMSSIVKIHSSLDEILQFSGPFFFFHQTEYFWTRVIFVLFQKLNDRLGKNNMKLLFMT